MSDSIADRILQRFEDFVVKLEAGKPFFVGTVVRGKDGKAHRELRQFNPRTMRMDREEELN